MVSYSLLQGARTLQEHYANDHHIQPPGDRAPSRSAPAAAQTTYANELQPQTCYENVKPLSPYDWEDEGADVAGASPDAAQSKGLFIPRYLENSALVPIDFGPHETEGRTMREDVLPSGRWCQHYSARAFQHHDFTFPRILRPIRQWIDQ